MKYIKILVVLTSMVLLLNTNLKAQKYESYESKGEIANGIKSEIQR